MPQGAERVVFLFAVLVRVAYLAAVYGGPATLQHADSGMWLEFAADPSGWLGNYERMPLYPLYLGLMKAAFGPSLLAPVLGQILVDAATCVLIGRIGMAFGPRLGFVAGALAAFNPTQVVLSCIVLGDTLFTFFVAGAILAAVRWLAAPGVRPAAEIAIWAGLALLNRSVVAPLLPIVPFAMAAVVGLRERDWRAAAMQAGVFALLSAGFAAPIVARNVADYGAWALTSQTGHHTANWIVPLVRQAYDGTPFARAQAEAAAAVAGADPDFTKRTPFEQSQAWSRYARTELARMGPGAIAGAWLSGVAINLFSPAVLMSPPLMALPRTGFYATGGAGYVEKISNFLFRNDNARYSAWLVAGALFDIPLKLLALAGAVLAIAATSTRLAGAMLAGWIVYVLLVSGPVASAKYRLPIEPACVAFVAVALQRLRDRRAA